MNFGRKQFDTLIFKDVPFFQKDNLVN